ncbi:unnamed protein product [Paramecium sonneborni]|uniref:Uncharacterized protein n=1 Tax=Paramecium sonneborni TaxID=65129 RepID=A0A8S1PI01_9CILI|nr:unnamed protein product [Paramecium sonneborni]
MKPLPKQQTTITMARPCSVSKEYSTMMVSSPDRQLVYGTKTQSQARVQTYVASPYMQSPIYEANKQILTSPNLPIQPSSPKKLLDSYHYKQKTLDYKVPQIPQIPQIENKNSNQYGDYKPFDTTKQLLSQVNQYDLGKYDFAKTYNFESNKENRDLNSNTEKRNQSRQELNPFLESKENIKAGLEFICRSPIQDINNQQAYQNYSTSNISYQKQTTTTTVSSKTKLQTEINKISSSLRELISAVQKQMGASQLPDLLNDKMIEVLSNFRKLEEIALSDSQQQQSAHTIQSSNDNEQKINTLTEDYNKLKGILEQLQTKMASLVQENHKLNKKLIEYEQKGTEDERKRKEDDERSLYTQQEFNRVLECLQQNQKENEDLKQQLLKAEKSKTENMVCRQLFSQDEQVRDLRTKYQNLQKDYEQLELKYKQSIQEKSFYQRDMTKSPSILRSPSVNNVQKQSKQNEQLELKLFQLQIENDNLKAEVAHNQVDSRQLDQKNSVIGQLEEKVKQTLREKAESEEHFQQLCYNLESQLEQFRVSLQQKELDLNQVNKQKKEIERDFHSSVQNYQIVQKGLDDKLAIAKSDYDKLLSEFKAIDSKKNKLQEDLTICEKQLEQSRNETNGVLNDNKKFSEKLSQIQKQNDQQSQQLQQYQISTQQLLKQLDNFKQQEFQFRQEIEILESNLNQTKQETKNQINDLNEALSMQIYKNKEKEKQVIDLIEEMSAFKDQYEVQKKVQQENINDLERKSRNLRIQLEETIEVKENEINDLKQNMEQQMKILDKRNALSNYDFEQREYQYQQDLQQKTELIESLKMEMEKIRSVNYNMQEEILKNNMSITQLQATINSQKNELAQAKQEQIHLMDLLKKRKEETEQLHQGLEEARKEQQLKKNSVEDSRRSMFRQQDLQSQLESIQRDNLALTQKINSLNNELNRKQREYQEKTEEYSILKRKYDETLQNLERLEKRWGEKIDQHRKI